MSGNNMIKPGNVRKNKYHLSEKMAALVKKRVSDLKQSNDLKLTKHYE